MCGCGYHNDDATACFRAHMQTFVPHGSCTRVPHIHTHTHTHTHTTEHTSTTFIFTHACSHARAHTHTHTHTRTHTRITGVGFVAGVGEEVGLDASASTWQIHARHADSSSAPPQTFVSCILHERVARTRVIFGSSMLAPRRWPHGTSGAMSPEGRADDRLCMLCACMHSPRVPV